MQGSGIVFDERGHVDQRSQKLVAWGRTAALTTIACLSLITGVLVYLTDRAASQAVWIPAVAAMSGMHLFGSVGFWLPSFVHPLAFSLFSATLMAPQPRWEYGACVFWFALNAAFEVGQHSQLRGPLVDMLRQIAGQGPIARVFENYFLRGTFDVADLVAAAFGAALAAAILRRVRIDLGNRHDSSLHS
jgi:hypothetical protein